MGNWSPEVLARLMQPLMILTGLADVVVEKECRNSPLKEVSQNQKPQRKEPQRRDPARAGSWWIQRKSDQDYSAVGPTETDRYKGEVVQWADYTLSSQMSLPRV